MGSIEEKYKKLRAENERIYRELAIHKTFQGNFADIIYQLDPQGKITSINPAVERYGYTVRELIGKSMLEFIHPDDREKAVTRIQEKRRKRREGSNPLELRLISKNRQPTPFEVESTGIFEPYIEIEAYGLYDGSDTTQRSFIGTHGIARDITKRKIFENALKESEDKYRSLFEFTPIMMHSINSEGKLVEVNHTWLEKMGYTKDEVIGLKSTVFLTRESQEKARRVLKDFFKKGYCHKVEYDFISKNKEIIQVELSAFVLKDINGNIIRSMAALEDVTQAKKSEEALKKSEYYLKEAQHTAKLGDWSINLETLEVKGSDEVFNIFELSREQNNLRSFSDYIQAEDLQHHILKIQSKISRRKSWETEVQIHLENKKTKWVKILGRPHREKDKKLKEYLGTIQDITESKKIEERLLQAKKLESVGRLAGGIAHDFNNILTSIMGYTEMLRKKFGTQNTDLDKTAEIILNCTDRAKQLTNQLLGFAGGGKYNPIPLDLNELIKKKIKKLGKEFDKTIKIHTKLNNSVQILGDRNQVNQIITNLLDNAREALTLGGDIFLETNLVTLNDQVLHENPDLKPGEYLMLSIKDTGENLDPATLKHLFDPFFTSKGTTGLGLATIYGIVKNHQGYISVNSNPGEGTEFQIFLPAIGEKTTDSTGNPKSGKKSATVLIIDDEELVRMVTESQLEELGHKAILAGDGLEGIKKFKSNSKIIDLVILDLIMPKIAGYDTFLALKEINPHIKVLLISGFTQSQEAAELLELGAVDFIQKPFRIHELSQKIQKYI